MKKPMWIWYFGDFELYHHLKLSMNRNDYGNFIPVFWKPSDCNRCVRFKKVVELKKMKLSELHVMGSIVF